MTSQGRALNASQKNTFSNFSGDSFLQAKVWKRVKDWSSDPIAWECPETPRTFRRKVVLESLENIHCGAVTPPTTVTRSPPTPQFNVVASLGRPSAELTSGPEKALEAAPGRPAGGPRRPFPRSHGRLARTGNVLRGSEDTLRPLRAATEDGNRKKEEEDLTDLR